MDILDITDPELSHYFRKLGIKLGDFFWSAWTNLYTDLVPKSDWLLFFDHILCYPEYPEIFYVLAVTELILKRDYFLKTPDIDELSAHLSQLKVDNIKLTLKKTIDILSTVLKDPLRALAYKRALPLAKPNYQAFMFLPKTLL